MKKKSQQKRDNSSPYASIDWDKASKLFAQKHTKIEARKARAADILRVLATVIDRGMVFIAQPDDPNAVEYVLHGTGPLNWNTRRIIRRFESQKYVRVKEHNGQCTVFVTRHGLHKALSYELNDMHLTIPKVWDKKWRVVIFDIPEKYKKLRDTFRKRLRQLGLYTLQDSVYISPYSCFDEVEFLRELYGIAFTVRYFVAEQIEDDALLRRHFGL